jgi:hypothetical protein
MGIAVALFWNWTTISSIDNTVITQIRARDKFAFCPLASMWGLQTQQIQVLGRSYNIKEFVYEMKYVTIIISVEHKRIYERKRSCVCVCKIFTGIVLLRPLSFTDGTDPTVFISLMPSQPLITYAFHNRKLISCFLCTRRF